MCLCSEEGKGGSPVCMGLLCVMWVAVCNVGVGSVRIVLPPSLLNGEERVLLVLGCV